MILNKHNFGSVIYRNSLELYQIISVYLCKIHYSALGRFIVENEIIGSAL